MIDIRKGTTDDIDELVRMRMAYIEADFGELESGEYTQIHNSLPDYFRRHLNKNLFAYIACDNNRIVSTVLLYISEKPANPHNIRSKMGEVLNVLTESDYRRQGIAERLIKNMLEDAKVMGLSAVKLDATEMGKPLYLKSGFEIELSRYTHMKYDL